MANNEGYRGMVHVLSHRIDVASLNIQAHVLGAIRQLSSTHLL